MSEPNSINQNRDEQRDSMMAWGIIRKVSDLIQGREKALDRYGREVASLFLLYLAAKMKEKKEKNNEYLNDIADPKVFLLKCVEEGLLLDKSIVDTVSDLLKGDEWDKIKEKFNEYAHQNSSIRGVAIQILRRSFYISSSQELNSLARAILMKGTQDGSETTILDIGCGDGTFMTELYRRNDDIPDAYRQHLRYTGLDKNEEIQKIAKIRAEVAAQILTEHFGDPFDSIQFKAVDCRELKEDEQETYDRIFVDLGRDGRRPWDDDVIPDKKKTNSKGTDEYPRLKNIDNIDLSLHQKSEKLFESEWYPALIAVNLLSDRKDGGRAVITMSVSALCGAGSADKILRQRFVSQGWVQQVILLPRPMQRFSRGRECLVVLSRVNKNRTVRMIDARGFYDTTGWRIRTRDSFIEEIVNAEPNGKDCCDVALDDIGRSEYNFYPVRYLMRVDGGEKLEDLAVITRGKEIPRSRCHKQDEESEDVQEDSRENREKIYYLSIGDIENGFLEINKDTIRLEASVEELKKMGITEGDYLKPYDILMGKILEGDRFGLQPRPRVAVIEKSDLEKDAHFIAGSNLFIFRRKNVTEDNNNKQGVIPKQTDIPKDSDIPYSYYLKAFLESDKCSIQLELAAAGSALSSISIKSLKEVRLFEGDNMYRQNSEYRETYTKLREVRAQLKELTLKTKKMFDDPSCLRENQGGQSSSQLKD